MKMLSEKILSKIESHRPHLTQLITNIRNSQGDQRKQLERSLADTYTAGGVNELSPSELFALTNLLR